MSTWKGKTRGGTFGYLFFIYLIKYLGITAAYGFLSLVVLYFIPFAPKGFMPAISLNTADCALSVYCFAIITDWDKF